MISAEEVLQRLQDGNRRFRAGLTDDTAIPNHFRRALTAGEQSPVAIILGCSDSRVPAEIVFDQGLGDLFVIRVAGNIVAPSQIGSVEFAATTFGTPLVVVLGHSQCGAVIATIDHLRHKLAPSLSRNLHSIVDRIRPAVEPLLEQDNPEINNDFYDVAIRANVRAAVDQLQNGSRILEGLVAEDSLRIVGATYSLGTGAVDFF